MQRLFLVALASLASACGGASDQRVSNLEARVAQLSQDGPSKTAIADSDRLGALEQQLAVLQRDVANTAASRTEAPSGPVIVAPAPRPNVASSTAFDAVTWARVDAALGVDIGGVTVMDGSYVIQRAWLARELAAISAAPAKAPKLAPVPGGVVVRLVKPKSLAAQLGLQNADVITLIDDHAVASPADISSALHASRGGVTKVKLLRKKRELQLDYKLAD